MGSNPHFLFYKTVFFVVLGILTLKGVQSDNIFVDESGRRFVIDNVFTAVGDSVAKYVTLIEKPDGRYSIIRSYYIKR